METKILQMLNASLEESLELEQLEQRIEMVIVTPGIFDGNSPRQCDDDNCDTDTPGKNCDYNICHKD